jgi:hypothetical protein
MSKQEALSMAPMKNNNHPSWMTEEDLQKALSEMREKQKESLKQYLPKDKPFSTIGIHPIS